MATRGAASVGLTRGVRHPTVERQRELEPGTHCLLQELDVQGQRLRMHSTVATFGIPLDVAASKLAIETFPPATRPPASGWPPPPAEQERVPKRRPLRRATTSPSRRPRPAPTVLVHEQHSAAVRRGKAGALGRP